MSRSRKKVCGGTYAICKSQKKGKRFCHKKFRMAEREGREPMRMREMMDSWDMGGDGKTVYTRDKTSELYKKLIRK